MRSTRIAAAFLSAAIALLASTAVRAGITYTPLGDTGSLTVTTLSPLQVASTIVASPYGTPVITTVTSGWKLTYTPTAGFFSAANNAGGGLTETSVMDGQLTFQVDFTSPVKLTVNIFEDGIDSKTGTVGDALVNVSGGGVVTPLAPSPTEAAQINGNLSAGTTFNTTNGWSSFLQISGNNFLNAYTSYRISIDNILSAEALANPSFSSALIAKKDFTIILTTDGSSGSGPPIPEPASLGVLALGSLALFARRRS